MRKFFQYIILCAVTLCSLISCETDDTLFPEPSVAPQLSAVEGEVRIVLADGATRAAFEGMTRAMVAADGNLTWQTGDKFTLIAKNSAGADAFEPCAFSYWISATAGSRSFFRGVPNQRMADGSYTYYAVYPHTTPVEGTTATFSLPAQQDGKYGKTDFMVARATGGALQVCDDNRDTAEPLNELGIAFKHQLHAMRFEIPRTGVLSSGVRRVHILFSEAVVGDIKVNMESSAVEYVNTSNKITVDFGAGSELQAGETFWVMTLPQAAFSRAVDIRFEDSQGNFTTRQLITLPSSQQYTAGRLTPIKMNVPTQYVGYTYLDATTVDTQLGEPVTHLHLDLPVGYYFPDYSQKHIAAENGEIHTFTLFNDIIDNTFRNSNITLTYESEHALIPTTTSFGDGLKVGQRNQYYGLITPWLFHEDFTNVTSNSDEYGKTDGAMMDKGGLVGWSGSRWKTDKGNGILNLSCYVGTTAGNTDIQYGRADTPPLTNIKPGKQPKIKVVYDLGLEENVSVTAEGTWLEVVWWRIQAQLYYGTTEYDSSNPITTGGSVAIGGSLGKGQGKPQNELGVINTGVTLMDKDDGYVANQMNKNISFTTSATSTTRITWFEDYYKTSGEPAAITLDLYLDNVRISITQ